jgi:hypothetical protein
MAEKTLNILDIKKINGFRSCIYLIENRYLHLVMVDSTNSLSRFGIPNMFSANQDARPGFLTKNLFKFFIEILRKPTLTG